MDKRKKKKVSGDPEPVPPPIELTSSLEERTKCANEELAVILQNYKLNLGAERFIDGNGTIQAKVVWYDAIDATEKA